MSLNNVDDLLDKTGRIRRVVNASGYPEVDHVELYAPPLNDMADSRNFVLCPGGAYDRSPCGTGTSAKLACLWADGKLKAGQVWRQAGILGTVFEGSVRVSGNDIIPTITGTAHVTAESTLILEGDDPFRDGIRR
jgi:4-hydroxyproline epimerase